MAETARNIDLHPTGWKLDEMNEEESFKSPQSSNIHGASYFPAQKLLVVLFKFEKTGGIKSVYAYENVTLKTWAQFMTVESKGVFFNAHIRPIYQTRKIA